MLAALIIVFREVFEAGLIIGIVLAVTRSVPNRNRWIGGGLVAGIAAACVVAIFAGGLSHLFAGMGQEVFNATILSIAVVMLTWHNVWMARHGRELAGDMRAIGQAVAEGSKSLLALAVVVAVAVLREGSEVVLFLYGVLASGDDTTVGVALGGFAGMLLGAATCALTYSRPAADSDAGLVRNDDGTDRAACRGYGGAGRGVSDAGELADRAGYLSPGTADGCCRTRASLAAHCTR